MEDSDKVELLDGERIEWQGTWKEFVTANADSFEDNPQELQEITNTLARGETYTGGGGASSVFILRKTKGYKLESVGTYIRADGWCFPMLATGGYHDDELVAIHIRDCDPEDEGYEWWQNLSPEDRKIVEAVKAKGGAR